MLMEVKKNSFVDAWFKASEKDDCIAIVTDVVKYYPETGKKHIVTEPIGYVYPDGSYEMLVDEFCEGEPLEWEEVDPKGRKVECYLCVRRFREA